MSLGRAGLESEVRGVKMESQNGVGLRAASPEGVVARPPTNTNTATTSQVKYNRCRLEGEAEKEGEEGY